MAFYAYRGNSKLYTGILCHKTGLPAAAQRFVNLNKNLTKVTPRLITL